MSLAEQGNLLEKDGDGIMKKIIYFGNRNEDALDKYEQAANKYKMAKHWKEAGDCHLKMVSCYLKLKSKFDAANCFVSAGIAYKKSGDEEKAIKMYQEAISINSDMGKFGNCAKLEKELGEILEDAGNLKEAAIRYKNSADFYEGENQKSSGISSLSKVGHIKALLDEFDEAIEIFENCASSCLEDKLLKWGAKDNLFKAAICQLARLKSKDEWQEAKEKVEKYKEMDVHYPDSYEERLISGIFNALEKKADLNLFTQALREYDKIKKLDNWATSLLTKVKGLFENPDVLN